MSDDDLQVLKESLSCLSKADVLLLLLALMAIDCPLKDRLDEWSDRAFDVGYALGFEHGETKVD